MVHALGYSQTRFDPSNPGRLCRGRERWVEGFPIEPGIGIHRLVVSGASFSDDTARDASRGLAFSGISVGEALCTLFPGQAFLGFCEQGEFGAVIEDAVFSEVHMQPRLAGRRMDPCVRWRQRVTEAVDISRLVSDTSLSADGFVPFEASLTPELEEALFLLTGQGDRTVIPQRRFQPAVLPALLECVPFVALLHMDKHAEALGIYSREAVDCTALDALAQTRGVLSVPFSIPPMLARWDRALYEMRLSWESHGGREFPVPPGERPSGRDVVASYEREE